MLKKDLLFLIIIITWIIFAIIQVIFKELQIFNLVPVIILMLIVFPKMIIPKYNNWLESKIEKKELTIKEIRLKKLKRIKRFKIFRV